MYHIWSSPVLRRTLQLNRSPDRVLDLGGSLESTIRLLETRNQPGYYACLSHRWGSAQPLRILSRNKETFQQGIPMVMLPKTFQDAVSTRQRLSIRYLWIDSLCIVQDSDEEWQRKSSKTATIFENAYHTNWPLLTRAWVFQERLLSPQILHFMNNRLNTNAASKYSQVMGNLTYESDIFPALSGLASRISALLKDGYMAGLWRSNLVEGLLWTYEGKCRPSNAQPKL
ncbi:heterokaryon incompatibility protein-domain-containing protein [Ilyonectria sp. MPI-CAGE-AT-0026]|nr:heterokaryon incompatibility protein-domain-containing protein [Ilyonectria sp. MPI-CAGE-AT-0026]